MEDKVRLRYDAIGQHPVHASIRLRQLDTTPTLHILLTMTRAWSQDEAEHDEPMPRVRTGFNP